MRIVLVGRPAERARLRAELSDALFEIAGEFESLADARAASPGADAVLLADTRRNGRRVASARTAPPPDDHIDEPLTSREIDVLELLAQGLPNKVIAGRLGISDQTVKFHVASIIGKLGASNRTGAVRRALRQGLIAL
jgi:DNA-binding NarL/FixJ family response regulator